MKLGIITAFHQRERLSLVWITGAERLMAQFDHHGIETNIYAAGDQPVLRRAILKTPGNCWIDMDNQHVGKKWNAVARAALDADCDYLLILGSDDFVSPSLVDYYAKCITQFMDPYVGLASIYVADPATARIMHLNGREKKLPPGAIYTRAERQRRAAGERPSPILGAGRLLHRSLFKGHRYFWDPKKNRGLDASLTNTLRLADPVVHNSTPTHFIVDVKTSANIWSYDALTEWFPAGALEYPGPLADIPEWPAISDLFPRFT